MKRLVGLLLGVWLGVQWGFCVVSVLVFNSDALDKVVATRIMTALFQYVNVFGLVACGWAWLACRHRYDVYRHQQARRLLGYGLLGLLLAWVMNQVVASYPHHLLVQWLGGTLGLWRGSVHVLNVALAMLGMLLCGQLLRWNSDLD